MGGIAGILESGKRSDVEHMLDKISHRGKAGRAILEYDHCTLGAVWTSVEAGKMRNLKQEGIVRDEVADGHYVRVEVSNGKLLITRDQLGVAPLYYGKTESGSLCFASEVKSLLPFTLDVKEFPPGQRYDGNKWSTYFSLQKREPLADEPNNVAKELHNRLADSIKKFISRAGVVGSWLSGGIDSSTMAALARPHVSTLHTFAAGMPDAPDLKYAREVADFIQSEHHEVKVSLDDLLSVLSEVIYHLESFDALLVRSSITNYLVARAASKYVPAVLSGEGGDELFAGYEYLKSLDPAVLPDELVDITSRLHNTALQRVDRCASAHGTVAHVGFLDPDVVDYAFRIPAAFKLKDKTEKWILRRAMIGALPDGVLTRTKAKFWEGAGVTNLLEREAERHISDQEFRRERKLPNGWILNTKEELLYYRIFHTHFGDLKNLSWMGRTKGAPKR